MKSGNTDLVLINSPRDIVSFRNSDFQDRRMPLGIMYIASYMKQQGASVRILDAEALSLGLSDIISFVSLHSPKIVGLNCHTFNRYSVYEIVKALKVIDSNVTIILGGPHPTLVPKDTLAECPQIDAVVIGEGEKTTYQIWRNLGQLENVPGIAFIKNAAYYCNPPMARIDELDQLPFPDLDDVPFERYIQYEDTLLPGLWHRAYLSASRGCRYLCTFCTENTLWQGRGTFRSAKSVMEEIQVYRQIYGINRFYFYDDLFTDWPDLKRFCEMCSDTDIEWSCSTRIDHMDNALIQLMSQGGCREIAFGIESGSEKLLKITKKGWQALLSKEGVGQIISVCVQHGITPRTHFMIGFPWEERADIVETVEFSVFLKKYGLTDANFFAVKVYPGTTFHQNIALISRDSPPDQKKRMYNAWSVFDWFQTQNQKVSAKLRRFNDIPEISPHPHLDSLALRQLVRNAYEIFFSDFSQTEVENLLFQGVMWRN